MTSSGLRSAAALRLIAVLLLLALAAGPAVRADAQTAPDVAKAASEAIRRLDLQLELPREPETSTWSWRIPLPAELFWGAVVLTALMLLYYLATEVLPGFYRSRRGQWEEADADGAPGAQAPEEAAMAADELAQQGRFVDAMHVLLLQSLGEIRRRLGEKFADSLTSREILRSVRLSDRGLAALRDIIARVELSYFGEHPARAADYQGCRASFDALTLALHGEAPA